MQWFDVYFVISIAWRSCWKNFWIASDLRHHETDIAVMASVRERLQHYKGASYHEDIIKWKHFPRYWPFVRGFHRSPVNSPHKGQWRGALMFSLICINGWVNNGEAGDLRRYRAHYDVTVILRKLCAHNHEIHQCCMDGWARWYLCQHLPQLIQLWKAKGLGRFHCASWAPQIRSLEVVNFVMVAHFVIMTDLQYDFCVDIRGPFYWYGLTLIANPVWNEITYPFPIFKGATVEVWE